MAKIIKDRDKAAKWIAEQIERILMNLDDFTVDFESYEISSEACCKSVTSEKRITMLALGSTMQMVIVHSWKNKTVVKVVKEYFPLDYGDCLWPHAKWIIADELGKAMIFFHESFGCVGWEGKDGETG